MITLTDDNIANCVPDGGLFIASRGAVVVVPTNSVYSLSSCCHSVNSDCCGNDSALYGRRRYRPFSTQRLFLLFGGQLRLNLFRPAACTPSTEQLRLNSYGNPTWRSRCLSSRGAIRIRTSGPRPCRWACSSGHVCIERRHTKAC